ncbi:MAG TPA: bifunctional riboflavin kinase/FAD synthetase [Bacteroidota bacterium]|nr:bifunctional riboflavin kinase/FAD synthetase [Bacteroidota bacterium]
MDIVFRPEEIEYQKNSVVSVGSFDGLHLAHQQLLRDVVDRAKVRKGRSVVITFEPHPKEVLTGKPVPLLTSIEERQQICEQLGIDVFYRIGFTYEFSRLTSREFYLKYVIQGCGASEVVEGYDHHFGRDREGSVEELLKLGREFEFSVAALKPVYVDEEIVSSTQIRDHLLNGKVERANRLLGRPYAVSGMVIRGDARGRELGYPTANLRLSDRKLVPQDGIYFAQIDFEGSVLFGMVSIGVRPTFFEQGIRTVEVHILDFAGDLYDKVLTVQFLRRLREERKFNGAQELIDQMHLDEENSRRMMAEFRLKISR